MWPHCPYSSGSATSNYKIEQKHKDYSNPADDCIMSRVSFDSFKYASVSIDFLFKETK